MSLDNKTIQMARDANYAALTTLFKDGTPQTHVMWVDTDGEHILINTEIHRVKYKNIKNDNRVTVMIWKKDDAFKFVEIRGRVVGEIPGDDAEKNMIKTNENFHNLMENRKRNAEERIKQLKNQALKDIKNTSVIIAIEAVEKLLKNSLDKSKLDKIYISSIEETKLALKKKSS